jgi:hypothetical protein
MARVTWPNEPPREEESNGAWTRPDDGPAPPRPPPPAKPYEPPPAKPNHPPPANAGEPSAVGPDQGTGQAPVYQPYPGQQPFPPPHPGVPYGARTTNGLAIAALVCSLAGVVTVISAPVGAVLGHLALREVGRTGQEGRSLAIAAIWVGWIITGLVLLGCCGAVALWRTTVPMR